MICPLLELHLPLASPVIQAMRISIQTLHSSTSEGHAAQATGKSYNQLLQKQLRTLTRGHALASGSSHAPSHAHHHADSSQLYIRGACSSSN